ncbi:MAG: hypothetical protein CMA34_04155 [Euryarchaeota archaeon]|nr:hypothetical protein [Euryarchaeota archaeon]
MSWIQRISIFLILIFLLPSLVSIITLPNSNLIQPVSASSCSSSNREPIWGSEAANISIQDYYWWGEKEDFSEDEDRGVEIQDTPDSYLPQSPLGTLTQDDDFSTSQLMANDSISGLRLNLTTGQKYTFCITAQHLNNGTILGSSNVDVYLLTEYDWETYQRDYRERHEEWRNWKNEVPIEWQSYLGSLYWKPFRDVHEYHDDSKFEFSVALDQSLVTNTMWQEGGPSWEEFYLIVDGWDNIYDDAGAPGHDVQVDIQVMVEERFALPNWTVSLTCCGLFLTVAAIPAVLHVRYQRAGLISENSQLIPKVSGTDSKSFGTMMEEDQ